MSNTNDTLTIEHVQAAIAALNANEVPIDEETKFIEVLPCGHTICLSRNHPPFIGDGKSMEVIKPCCQKALNEKWSKYFD